MKQPYQDIWRKGKLVKKGRRECAARYEAIRETIEAYCGRGCTVADVGGWDGYFPTRLREDLKAKATNIDPRRISLPYHRQMRVTAKNVDEIGPHDAILCLSVLHHMDDWEAVYEGLKRQCPVLIIEVCHPDEVGSDSPVMRETGHRIAPIYERVMAEAAELLCETPCLDDQSISRPTVLVLPAAEAASEPQDDDGDTPVHRVLGIVEPGTGQAAELMAETDPEEWESLGYEPFSGTLNLCVSEEDHAWLKTLPGVQAPGLKRSTNYVPAEFAANGCTAAGHIHFARSPRGRKVIELVAPIHLKSALCVDDGDSVEVTPGE